MNKIAIVLALCAASLGQDNPPVGPLPGKPRDRREVAAKLAVESLFVANLIPTQIKSAQSPNNAVRKAAFKVLADTSRNSRARVEDVIFLLKSPEQSDRVAAIAALKNLSRASATIFPALIDATGDGDEAVRADAVLAMDGVYSISEYLVNELISIARLEDKEARKVALEALAILGGDVKDATASLIKAMLSKDKRKKIAVLKNGKTVSSRARDSLAVIIDALEDKDESIRTLASDVLAGMTEAARISTPSITLAINDPDAKVRVAAVEAWKNILPSLIVPSLLDSRKNQDLHIRQRIVDALGDGGVASREAVPVLIRVLRDDDSPEVRMGAALALGRIGQPFDVISRALRSALADPDNQVRATAFYVLRLFDPEIQSALSHAVQREVDRTPLSDAATHFSQLLFIGILGLGFFLLVLGLAIGQNRLRAVMAAAGFFEYLGNSRQGGDNPRP